MALDQVVTINNGLQPAGAAESADSYAKRDSNGDIRNRRTVNAGMTLSEGADGTAVAASQTASVTVGITKSVWPFDGTGGAYNATLPLASAVPDGTRLTIMRTQSGGSNVTIVPGGSDTINGSTSTIALSAAGALRTVQKASSSTWLVVGLI